MTAPVKPTPAQLRLIRAVDYCSTPEMPADGWAEVFTHFDACGDGEHDSARFLVMRNFDASAKACEKRGWISVVSDDVGLAISVTPAGRAVLDAAEVKP